MPVSLALPHPLVEARFLRHPNRFLVQARLENGEVVTAHLADPGRLRELLVADRRIWLREAQAPQRRTKWSAVLVQTPVGTGLVSVDTTLPNRLIAKALRRRAIHELQDWSLLRSETPWGRSRFDFLLESDGGQQLYMEVKSVTLAEDGVGLFPDAVTARGARHLRELSRIVRQGLGEAAVLFIAQRPDVRRITAATHIDPGFTTALAEAREAGVQLLGRCCKIDLPRLTLGKKVPVG